MKHGPMTRAWWFTTNRWSMSILKSSIIQYFKIVKPFRSVENQINRGKTFDPDIYYNLCVGLWCVIFSDFMRSWKFTHKTFDHLQRVVQLSEFLKYIWLLKFMKRKQIYVYHMCSGLETNDDWILIRFIKQPRTNMLPW